MSIYISLDGLFTIGSSHTTLPTSSGLLTHAHVVSEFMIGLEKMKANVTVEEPPIPFSPFSSADCTMFNHFSFNDFIVIAFLDIAGDLDAQI